MLIGKFVGRHGEDFWTFGEDVDSVIRDLRDVTGESANPEDVKWFQATPVRVTCKCEYTIEEM